MIITTFNQSSEQALKNCPALLTMKRFLILSVDDGVHLYLGILIPTLDLNARFLGFETRAGHDEKKLHFLCSLPQEAVLTDHRWKLQRPLGRSATSQAGTRLLSICLLLPIQS